MSSKVYFIKSLKRQKLIRQSQWIQKQNILGFLAKSDKKDFHKVFLISNVVDVVVVNAVVGFKKAGVQEQSFSLILSILSIFVQLGIFTILFESILETVYIYAEKINWFKKRESELNICNIYKSNNNSDALWEFVQLLLQ
jgi:hypothetical protein